MSIAPDDLSQIRDRLAAAQGQAYWQSLEEVADSAAFQAFVKQEFPQNANQLLSRRRFLTLSAASLALAGLAACAPQPPEKIVPYATQPENLVPGVPQYFATAHRLGGFAQGIIAESHTGRPTHIEGNPDHPASLGAADIFAQASLLTLYDPERSTSILHENEAASWDNFLTALHTALSRQDDGAGLRILTETVTSPTLAAQINQLLDLFPQARWHQYEPINLDNVWAGTELAYGQRLMPQYRFDRAQIILSLEDDFLSIGPGRQRYIHDFSQRRRVRASNPEMNRLYVVESTPSLTGSMADHRWQLRSSQAETFARALAARLGVDVPQSDTLPDGWQQRLDALADDLNAHAGSSLVLAGQGQPPVVHALAHAINQQLNNTGETVIYTEPPVVDTGSQAQSIRELSHAMHTGEVDSLLIIGGNPAYTTGPDIDFAGALSRVAFSVHLSQYRDETSSQCRWHIPQAHDLEYWSDARAYDGSVTIIQPLIEPLYNGISAHTLLAHALGQTDEPDSLTIVQQQWRGDRSEAEFVSFWRRALRDGVIPDTALPPVSVERQSIDWPEPTPAAGGIELVFRPDPSVWDGQYSNNGWLQELPRPFSKLTWDNAALISPRTAETLQLSQGDIVLLRHGNQSVEAPVWIMPGQTDESITVHFGYGRTQAGQMGNQVGFNAYSLYTTAPIWFGSGVEVQPTGRTHDFATTQSHHRMEGRDLVRSGPIEAFLQLAEEPEAAQHPSLYSDYEYDGHAWGMSIDLNACIGCNACVIACQSENNIPVVGREEVAAGREMHWIRVDGYYAGALDQPDYVHQPVTCMHCENAPCEPVCPVSATTHSAEGINQMVYNRCVGTRYCSNNCPYKVRRFNFLEYADPDLRILNNPDVSVRSKGVMEKCTYCIQRINRARINAQNEERPLADGDIVTACQAACPAQAIVFGDTHDPESQVAQLKAQPHHYDLLEQLNTRPRTGYLSRFKNPNPALIVENER